MIGAERTSCQKPTMMTKKKKNNCDICQRCGICCVSRRIEDFSLQFYKPAFKKCPHLEYLNEITVCKVYGTAQMPLQCRNNVWDRVPDAFLSAYKHNENMEHLLWAKNNGHTQKMGIFQDIEDKNYEKLHFLMQTFVVPFLKHIPNTLATNLAWLEMWDIVDYLNDIPLDRHDEIIREVYLICKRLYAPKKMPEHICKIIETIDVSVVEWLIKIKKMIWSLNYGQ